MNFIYHNNLNHIYNNKYDKWYKEFLTLCVMGLFCVLQYSHTTLHNGLRQDYKDKSC